MLGCQTDVSCFAGSETSMSRNTTTFQSSSISCKLFIREFQKKGTNILSRFDVLLNFIVGGLRSGLGGTYRIVYYGRNNSWQRHNRLTFYENGIIGNSSWNSLLVDLCDPGLRFISFRWKLRTYLFNPSVYLFNSPELINSCSTFCSCLRTASNCTFYEKLIL